jgi:hypothetical protein
VTCLVGRAANRAGDDLADDDLATVVTDVVACTDIVFDGGDIVVPVQKTDFNVELILAEAVSVLRA